MSAAAPATDTAAVDDNPGRTLLRVAWLAILLGLLIQLILLIAAVAQGKEPTWAAQLADAARSVSWATLVCVGVALGRSIPGNRVANMGFLGLLSGPLAFQVAKVVHRGVNESLKVAPAVAALSPMTVGLIKALEYGSLGVLVAWVSRKHWGKLGAHLSVGLGVGLLFGILVYRLTNAASMAASGLALPSDKVLSIFINETVFPMGCAMVLYSSDAIRRRLG